MRTFRVRWRQLRWQSHAWLARHPRLRRVLRATGSLKGNPEAIARGVAIGLFIGLTPTVGLQTLLMIVICLLLSGNFPIAFSVSFISNPFTMAPLYWGYHELGEAVFTGLPLAVFSAELETGSLSGIGDDIVFTGFGSLLIAVPFAVAAYLLTHMLLARLALKRYQRWQASKADAEDENA